MDWSDILNIITAIASIIILILLIIMISTAKKIPNIINDKIKSKREFNNNHNLQVEAYFRES